MCVAMNNDDAYTYVPSTFVDEVVYAYKTCRLDKIEKYTQQGVMYIMELSAREMRYFNSFNDLVLGILEYYYSLCDLYDDADTPLHVIRTIHAFEWLCDVYKIDACHIDVVCQIERMHL